MATFTPVRMPGSRSIVALGPAGAASSKSFKLLPKTRMASSSAASRSLSFKSKSMRVNSLIFQAKRAVSVSQASAGFAVSLMSRCLAKNWAQSACSSFSSIPGLSVKDNKSSLTPRNKAKAR